MIEATCSACGTVNRVAEGDLPAGAKFLTCSSCKARVVLKATASSTATLPRAAVIPAPPMPKAPPLPRAPLPAKPASAGPDLADLPAPKRQSALAGIEASKPAPKSGLDIVDLPAPKSKTRSLGSGALDLDMPTDLPAPAKRTAAGLADLPAPKRNAMTPPIPQPTVKPANNDIVDLPAPRSPAGLAEMPVRRTATPPAPLPTVRAPAPTVRAPAPPSAPTVRAAAAPEMMDIVDLPAPKGISDLPTPKGGSSDLPAPKGFFDDLPQPAKASKQAKVDLPAPKGFFDDLPQPAKAGVQQPSQQLAPKGFFDDLPQPTKPTTPSPPVPKSAGPVAPEARGFFDDVPAPVKPGPHASGGGGVFDDLPEPTKSANDFSSAELDLGPPVAAAKPDPVGPGALDLDPGPELDLGLPTASSKGAAARGDFGDLDLSKPTAPPPPAAAAKSGITIKASTAKPSIKASGEGSALSALPAHKLSGELQLDLEDDPTRKPVGAAAVAKRADTHASKPGKAQQKAPVARPKRSKVVLGIFAGLTVLGAGGFFGYKRYADKKQREADIAEHLEVARKAIHDIQPTHWTRAATEAQAVLETDETNVEAIGLRAEAMIGGALDNGIGGTGRALAGKKLVTDAIEANITGPQLETAQTLAWIAAKQPDRAVTKLDQMTKQQPKNGFLWLYLGWAQDAKGDPTAAVKSFDTAIAADPKVKLPALYARGKAKLRLIDLDGAKADFAAVLELAKDHLGAQVGLAASLPSAQSSQREADLLAILARKDLASGDPRAVWQAWTLAGDVARVGGRLDVARERYRQALTLSKLDVPALVGLARVELRDGKLSVAADNVEKALSQLAEDPDALLTAAELYIKQGKLTDALAISQKLATKTPPLPPLQRANLQLVVGEVLEAQNKDEDAIEAWIEGAKLAGDIDLSPMMAAVTKLGALAKKAADNKDDKKAAEYRGRADTLLSSLADRAQDDPQLSKALGAAYLGAGDPVKAEKFLARSVEMRGNDIEARLELAAALAQLQNRTDDALAQLKAAQDLDPARKDIALAIATTLEFAKRDEAALEAYGKLLANKDVTVQARVHAGRFFARKGDYKRAGEQGDPIVAAEPDNPAGHYLRGEGHLAAGKLDEARKELMTAVDGDPDPQYLDAQGRAAEASVVSTGDTKYYDLALRAYGRAVEVTPNMFNAQAGIGRVHIARKEWTQALPPLGLANKLEPKDAEVMYNIGLAYKSSGHPNDAVEWLVAASRDKQDADTYWQLAQLYNDANRGGETAKMLREATHLAQQKETKTGTKVTWLTDAYYMLGQTDLLLHDNPGARAAFEAYVGRNPPPGEPLKEAKRLLATELRSN